MKPVCEMDQVIGEYIENHEKNEFSDVLSKDERLEAAFYLSELPNGLFGWYPFEKSGKVLQIGSWFGGARPISRPYDRKEIQGVCGFKDCTTKHSRVLRRM